MWNILQNYWKPRNIQNYGEIVRKRRKFQLWRHQIPKRCQIFLNWKTNAEVQSVKLEDEKTRYLALISTENFNWLFSCLSSMIKKLESKKFPYNSKARLAPWSLNWRCHVVKRFNSHLVWFEHVATTFSGQLRLLQRNLTSRILPESYEESYQEFHRESYQEPCQESYQESHQESY